MVKLHEGQQQVADCNARFRLVYHGRRWGGTTLALSEALRFALENRGSMVAVIVPFWRMVRRIHWPKLIDMIGCGEIMTAVKGRRIHLRNGSSIVIGAANNECTLRGLGLDMAVFDVAGMMTSDIWMKVVRPALTDRCGKALFCYTPPSDKRGFERAQWLKDIEDTDMKSWAKFIFKTEDSPFVPRESLVEAEEAMSTDDFRTEFLAEWPE